MSDSDDTDILLLIPPDFFSPPDHSSADEQRPINNCCVQNSPTCSEKGTTLLKTKETAEIHNNHPHLDRSTMNHSSSSPPSKFYHSTPYTTKGSTNGGAFAADGLINEIDNYLVETPVQAADSRRTHKNSLNDYRALANEAIQRHQNLAAESSGSHKFSSAAEREKWRPLSGGERKYDDHQPLISLSTIWGNEAEPLDTGGTTLSQHEERIRRQHCEKTIQILQSRILEHEQKISVAIKVDHQKDEALNRFHTTNAKYLFFLHNIFFVFI